jgi:hypothetical protein
MRPKQTKTWMAGIAAIALVCCAVTASADTTTVRVTPDSLVTPGSPSGWVLATQNAIDGDPIAGFRMAGPGQTPEGSGCFHFFTDILDGADPLEKIYLGTNNHSTVSLADITSFKYYTYLHARDYDGGGGSPDGQPPIVEIITDSGPSTQQRRFVFKPWGWWGGRHVAKDTWQEWDMMIADEGTHNHWEMLQNDNTNCRGDWAWLKNRYGSVSPMHFATPAVGDYMQGYVDKNSGDYRFMNQSGTSISIRVGSGQTLLEGAHAFWNPDTQTWITPRWAWWRESCGIDAYADKLVIGVNGVENVYDFERGTAMTVGIGTGACRDPIIATAKDNFFFAVFGKVLADPGPTGSEFYLDDGSGKKIKVITTNSAQQDQYYRAKGTLEWNSGASRYDLRSSVFDICCLN